MFKYMQNWLNSRVIRNSTIIQSTWDKAFSQMPLIHNLSLEDKNRLIYLAILFLDKKKIQGAHGLVVTEDMQVKVALQACLLILKFDINEYSGWTLIIMYPSGFITKQTIIDEYGIAHNVQSDLAGEAWLRGPVILAWDEVKNASIIDGHNLVVHEFAHKLDMQNGVANGYPPLHADMSPRQWANVFSAGYDDFKLKCESHKNIAIDCYGASSPAEFFAVMSEVFFERPNIIIQYYPDVYEELRKYYKQDTLARFID